MDELEISGKRYISAKRIAKENKYHPDYMGQLIRAGRVVGSKVGRAWYVDEESFANYLAKENKQYASPAHATEPVLAQTQAYAPVAQNNIQPISRVVISEPPAGFRSKPIAPPEPVVEEDEFVEEEKEIEKPVIVEKKIPIYRSPLTYIPDNSPLFPEIKKKVNSTIDEPISEPVYIEEDVEDEDEYRNAPVVVITQHEPRKKGSILKKILVMSVVGVVASVVFAFAFFGSLGINSTVIVEQGKPANVLFSQGSTFCFIFGNCQTQQK